MDKDFLQFLSTPAGLFSVIGILVLAGAAMIWSQSRYQVAVAKGRAADSDATKLIIDELKDSIETIKREREAEKREREKTIVRLQEGQHTLTEQVAFLTEQQSQLIGANGALKETNNKVLEDNYKLATDLGVATEKRSRLEVQIETLKAEVARLTKAHDECNHETAKERAAYENRIDELTAQIAELQSELAARQEPIEAKVTVTLQGSEQNTEPADNENITPAVSTGE